MIGHKNGKQIWLLGAIDNNTKDFRIEGTYTCDSITLKKFITLNTETGNNIVTDGWSWYAFLDAMTLILEGFPTIMGEVILASAKNQPPI